MAQFKRARGAEFNLDGVKMKATQAPSKNEILRHIDKTGVERVLDDKATSGDHGLKYRLQKDDNLRQDIIKALNSINQIAPHKNIQNRMTATSDNGYFLVFDSTRIITAFKPEKGAKEYFKENSVTLKQEVIKSKIFKLWWKK